MVAGPWAEALGQPRCHSLGTEVESHILRVSVTLSGSQLLLGPRPRPPGAVPRVFLRDADAQTSSRHRPKVSNRPTIRSCIRQTVTGHRHAPCLVRGTGGAALDAKLRYLPAPPPPRGERETSKMISGSDRCATACAVWLTWHDAAFPP